MTCRTCKHRLDVTLWGCWLATGCRIVRVLRTACDEWAPGEGGWGGIKSLEPLHPDTARFPIWRKNPPPEGNQQMAGQPGRSEAHERTAGAAGKVLEGR